MSDPAPSAHAGQAPTHPPRILIVGPVSAGRAALARHLAAAFDCALEQVTAAESDEPLARDDVDLVIVECTDTDTPLPALASHLPCILIGDSADAPAGSPRVERDEHGAYLRVLPTLVEAEIARARAERERDELAARLADETRHLSRIRTEPEAPSRTGSTSTEMPPSGRLDDAVERLDEEVRAHARGIDTLAERFEREVDTRRAAQAEARRSNRRLEHAIEATRAHLWEWNVRSGAISHHPAKGPGTRPTSRLADHVDECHDLEHPDDRERILAAVAPCLSGERESYRVEYRARDTDGSWRWVSEFGTVVERDADGPLRILGANIDVHEATVARQALVESEARFRDFTAVASDWFWETDADLRYTYVSDRYEAVTGRRAADLLGRTREEFAMRHGGADPEGWARLSRAAHSRRDYRNIVAGIESGGERHWYRVSAKAMHDTAGRFSGFRGIGVDVTDEIRARDRLDVAERRLSDAVHAIPHGVALFDEDDRLVTSNARWRAQLGEPISDSVRPGMSFETIVRLAMRHSPPSDAHGTETQWLERRLARHRSSSAEPIELHLPDDVWVIVHEHRMEDGGTLLVSTDISDLKARERALTESDRRFRDLTESASDWYWEMDAELRFTYLSDRFEAISGYSAEAFLGRRREELPEESRGVDARAWRQVLDTMERRESYRDLLMHMRRPDGSPLVLRASGKALVADDGTFLGYRGTSSDVTVQVEAADRARAAEQRLADALRLVSDSYALFDADDRLVMCNDTYRFGLNARFPDRIVPGITFEEILRAAFEAGHTTGSDDPEQWIAWRLAHHRDPGEPITIQRDNGGFHYIREHRTADGHTILVITDITELKRRELELIESEARFRDFAELAADWFWATDAELRYTYVSERYEAATGRGGEVLLGRTALECFEALGDGPETYAEYMNALDSRTTLNDIETHIRHENGAAMVARTNAKPVFDGDGAFAGYRGVTNEVTEHYRAQRNLGEQKTLFETIVNSLPDALVRVDTRRTIEFANAALTRTFGYSPTELIGKSSRILYANDEEYASVGRTRSTIDTPNSALTHISRFRRKNGEEFPVEATTTPVKDIDGKTTGYLGLLRDVTDRERAESDRAALEAQLRQSRKLEAIGQLTGGIAHDFNNILASILGYTSLALERHVEDAESKLASYLRETQSAGERGRALVAQLLTFSRGGNAPARRVDLARCVDDAVRLLRPTLASTVRVDVNVETPVSAVLIDPVQAQQLIMNLFINARDAMPDGGTIDVEIGSVDVRDTHCTACRHPVEGAFVELGVSDRGTGIPADEMDRIFDPFFSTKEVGAGTGMGLSVVHGIVHRHAGHVLVDSTPGAGARFRVLFPALDAPPDEPVTSRPTRATDLEAPAPSIHILVVDDEPSVAGFVCDLLAAYGYEPDAFTDPAAALERLRADPERYSLVITDQTMPGLTGVELVARIRALRARLPVLLCTGYSESVDARVVATWKRARYLAKPVPPRGLLAAVRELLAAAERER